MANLEPTGMYELDYGTINWHTLVNTNFQILNDILAKLQILWSPADYALSQGVFLRWNGSSWEPVDHANDETAHGLTNRTEDIVFSDANKGIVLIDRSDGTQKRLYIENGELKVEDV